MEDDFAKNLEEFRQGLNNLRKEARRIKTQRVSRKVLREEAESLGRYWFSTLAKPLEDQYALGKDILQKYSKCFRHLVIISAPNNRKASYLSLLNTILKGFKDEVVIPVKTFPPAADTGNEIAQLLAGTGTSDESQYFEEAVSCSSYGFCRASIVLGWCAAVDRVHKSVERLGFEKFNEASQKMRDRTSGRFRRFSKVFNITSLSELRQVFDGDLLWVLEGMGLIDGNQHKRLSNCFDMRNHSAHPGEAPITKPNLISFYSDIVEIILNNAKFTIS